jgi:hypothetical protein
VVDPDPRRLLDVNQISTSGRLAHLQVSDDHVADLDQPEATADQACYVLVLVF